MRTLLARTIGLLLVVGIGGAAPVAAEVFCTPDGKDPRIEMPATSALPWGAVGYINNGCTATLISQSYVLTAGHCVTNTGNASWQQGLSFFPNFHPSVTPQAFRIDRAVVGARADVGPLDWAIAHLEKPVTGFPTIPLGDAPETTPFTVALGGYGRDLNRTSPRPTPKGAPCANAFCPGGNVWWDAALVQPRCSVRQVTAFELLTDCGVVGGNSGSPFILTIPKAGTRTFEYRAVGVIHGGSPALLDWTKGAPSRQQLKLTPVCVPLAKASVSGNLNGGPSARHFRFAPFFAENVAVVTSPSSASRSIVLTSDSGASRIVARERTGSTLSAPFSDHAFFGFLLRPTRLAGLARANGAPGVAALASNGRLFVRLVDDGDWGNWLPRALPAGITRLVDLDGSKDELYAVGGDGRLYRTRVDDPASAWLAFGAATYKRVTVARDAEGIRHVYAVTTAGRIDELIQDGKAWSYPFKAPIHLPQTTPPRPHQDVDAAASNAGIIHLVALDVTGRFWSRTSRGGHGKPSGSGLLGWSPWTTLDIRLFETAETYKNTASAVSAKYGFWQDVQGPPLDEAVSVTAHTLPEKAVTGHNPLTIFATDARGNVYSSSRRCVGPNLTKCFWAGWKPFAG